MKDVATIEKMDAEEFGEYVTQRLHTTPATLRREEIDSIEEELEVLAPFRRAALGVLTKSGHELIEHVTSERDNAVSIEAISYCTQNLPKLLRAIADDIEQFHGRALVALAQREDMEEIEAEVRSELCA